MSVLTTKAQHAARLAVRHQMREAQKVQSWHLFDASEYPVGKLASAVTSVLRATQRGLTSGKHKPVFENHEKDCGDFVVIVNAGHVHFTGNKWDQKLYRRHSGYPGALKQRTAREQQTRKPGDVLRRAIYGMLPKNKNRSRFMSRVRIYAGPTHPHEAQFASQTPLYSPLDHLRQMDWNYFSKSAFPEDHTFD